MSINTTVILNTHHNALPMCSRSGDTSIDINCGLHVQIRTRLACLDLLHRHHPTHTEAGASLRSRRESTMVSPPYANII